MRRPRVLLQTSIPFTADDWHAGRFSLLAEELRRSADLVVRDRQPGGDGVDPVIAGLDRSKLDEVWLMAVDGGDACGGPECAALNRFHEEGGGILTARDHADMGKWLRSLGGPGAANYFHDSTCWEPDPTRHCPDDRDTPSISFPNYHSGANGDVQRIECPIPDHPLMRAEGGPLVWFPAHPHEGAISPPPGDARARTVARGKSSVSGRGFDLVVAFERTPDVAGRAVVHSSFHHFADLNWDPALGAPSFVTERASDAVRREPRLLDDIREHVRNCVSWLHPDAQ